MNVHITSLKLWLNSAGLFYFAAKLASFVNGNENEASAGLFLKHERSFATGFLSGLSYKELPKNKVEFHNSLISQLGENLNFPQILTLYKSFYQIRITMLEQKENNESGIGSYELTLVWYHQSSIKEGDSEKLQGSRSFMVKYEKVTLTNMKKKKMWKMRNSHQGGLATIMDAKLLSEKYSLDCKWIMLIQL